MNLDSNVFAISTASSAWTALHSTPLESGRETSSVINCRHSWEALDPCTALFSSVSSRRGGITELALLTSYLVAVQGVRDLVWMPIDQYRKDRRIVRGFQRGASSFSSSTAMAAIDLTNRFVNIIQHTAQFAHDVVSPATHNRLHHASGSLPSSQPRDIKEGMTTAYTMIREGVNDTVRTVTNASSQADDMSGAIGIVIRQIPSTILRPLIGVSQATSNVLVGARNQIAPEARKDDIDKFKKATN